MEKIEKKLWLKFDDNKYRKVKRYINRWHEEYGDFPGSENFHIFFKDEGENIDLGDTLADMSDELLFKIAVDLGVEVPGLIYSVAEIKGVLATKYEDVAKTFEKACTKVIDDPATSISMAYSALELLIKRICEHPELNGCNNGDSLYKLATHILKEFGYFPDKKLNQQIRAVGSGLLKVSQALENIRSNNTEAHGTVDLTIDEPIYAMFIVNSVSTIGLFLLNYFEKHYDNELNSSDIQDFNDIPF